MDPLTMTVTIASTIAVIKSIALLVEKWRFLKKKSNSLDKARIINIKLERSDGTPIEVEINQAKLGTKEIEALLGSIRFATEGPSVTVPNSTAEGEKK